MVWYERYIVISIPYEDFVPSKEQVQRARGVNNNKAYRKYETDDVASEEAFVQSAPPTQQNVGQGVVSLPYWWVRAKDEDNRVYYINNFKKKTQWKPPSPQQIEKERHEMSSVLAPPPYDSGTKSANRFKEVKRKSLIKRKSIIKERRASKRVNIKPESSKQRRTVEEGDKPIKEKKSERKSSKKRKHREPKGERKSRDNNNSVGRNSEGGNRRSKKRNDDRGRRNESRGNDRYEYGNGRRSENRRGDRPRRSQPRSDRQKQERNDADNQIE